MRWLQGRGLWYNRGMAQQQETPIHWDQHASRWNLTLIFGLVVAILGIITANLLLTPLGLLMGGL